MAKAANLRDQRQQKEAEFSTGEVVDVRRGVVYPTSQQEPTADSID